MSVILSCYTLKHHRLWGGDTEHAKTLFMGCLRESSIVFKVLCFFIELYVYKSDEVGGPRGIRSEKLDCLQITMDGSLGFLVESKLT